MGRAVTFAVSGSVISWPVDEDCNVVACSQIGSTQTNVIVSRDPSVTIATPATQLADRNAICGVDSKVTKSNFPAIFLQKGEVIYLVSSVATFLTLYLENPTP